LTALYRAWGEDGKAMRIIRIWNGKPIIMNVCRRCGIGAGRTL
jgi:hypothetical protein